MCTLCLVRSRGTICILVFFSSRRRHTRCALVTGVQTCALPISPLEMFETTIRFKPRGSWRPGMTPEKLRDELDATVKVPGLANFWIPPQIGRASCRERVCQYV